VNEEKRSPICSLHFLLRRALVHLRRIRIRFIERFS
jgi:hypothetical protein